MDINDQIITMLFPGFIRKIQEDYDKLKITIDPDSFNFYKDPHVLKMGRIGVYGWCKLNNGKSYKVASSVDFKYELPYNELYVLHQSIDEKRITEEIKEKCLFYYNQLVDYSVEIV